MEALLINRITVYRRVYRVRVMTAPVKHSYASLNLDVWAQVMGNTTTRFPAYWQYTFCHQPKVECSFCHLELVADFTQLALDTCLEVIKIHKFARFTVDL